MIEQIIASECGILFEDEELRTLGIIMPVKAAQNRTTLDSPAIKEPDTVSNLQRCNVGSSGSATRPSSSSDPEFEDAIAPLFDDLQTTRAWWSLEIIPLPWSWQDEDGKWHVKWR